MTSITSCLDNDEIVLFGLTSNRELVTNTTSKCDNIISCLNLLCETSDIPNVSMTCFMGSPLNKPQITRLIYNQSEYDIRRIVFILLISYFIITITLPICYYGYKLISTYIRRINYIDVI